MSVEAASDDWTRVLDELERRVPPAPDLVDLMAEGTTGAGGSTAQPGPERDAAWRAPDGVGALPAHLADRARSILALIEERARQTRDVQQEIERHRGALRETAPRPSTTPLLLDRSA